MARTVVFQNIVGWLRDQETALLYACRLKPDSNCIVAVETVLKVAMVEVEPRR